MAERTRDRDAAAATLWREHGANEVIAILDGRLRVITTAQQGGEVQGVGDLLARLADTRRAAVPDLVAAAVALPEGPLDAYLHVLLDGWARSDIDSFAAAIPGLIATRPAVASAAAYGFRAHRWASLDPRLARAHREALTSADPQLRGQWLAAAGEMLRSDPVEAVPLLIDAAESPPEIAAALDSASRYDADGWSASLDQEQSLAVLALTRVCGWQTWGVQRIVAGIARAHPRAVLDALAEDPADGLTVDAVDGLPAALASHAAELADWLRHLLAEQHDDEWWLARLLPAVLGPSLTDGAATAVADVVASAGADELRRAVKMLRQCDGFPIAHPDLVVVLLARAQVLLGTEALEEVRRLLVAAALPSGGRWSPAAADETHVARLDRAVQLSQDMALPPSARTFFDETARAIQAVMEDEARQWADDED